MRSNVKSTGRQNNPTLGTLDHFRHFKLLSGMHKLIIKRNSIEECMYYGKEIVTVVPFPVSLSTLTSPLWDSTILWTIASPRPVPDCLVVK